MTNKIKLSFVDKSNNESGFNIYADEEKIASIEKSSGEFVTENCEILSTNTVDAGSIDETYEVATTASKGNKTISVSSYNSSGESAKIEIGSVDIYDRSDLVIYIGDEYADGAGSVGELSSFSSVKSDDLSKLIEGNLISRSYESSGYVNGNWVDADPLIFNNKVGAEVSYMDNVKNLGLRKTSIWKLTVPSGTVENHFSISGSARNFIDQNLISKIDQIKSLYNQPRVVLIIINLGIDVKTAYEGYYKDLLDYLRGKLGNENLPVIITDRTGEKASFQENVQFGIQDSGYNLYSNFNTEYDIYGYYGEPVYYKYGYTADGTEVDLSSGDPVDLLSGLSSTSTIKVGFKWYKKYNLDFTPYEGLCYIECENKIYTKPFGDVYQEQFLETFYRFGATSKFTGNFDILLDADYNPNYASGYKENPFYLMYSQYARGAFIYPNGVLAQPVNGYYQDPTGLSSYSFSQNQHGGYDYATWIAQLYSFDLPGTGTFIKGGSALGKSTTNPYVPGFYSNSRSGVDINDLKKLVVPFRYPRKDKTAERGIITPESMPTVASGLVDYLDNTYLANAFNYNLGTADGQVKLGKEYARIKNALSSSGKLVFTPKIWVDATKQVGNDTSVLQNHGSLSSGILVDTKNPASFGSHYINDVPVYKFNNTIYKFDNPFGDVELHPHKYIFFVGQMSAQEAYLFISTEKFPNSNAHLRFLSHFGWSQGVIYFDYARVGSTLHRISSQQPEPEGSSYVATFMYDKTLDKAQLRLNGVVIGENTNLVDSYGGLKLNLGGLGNQTQDVKMGEFITCDESIGTSGIELAEKYLAEKWNINLGE